jgi:hypothetical protein
MSTKKEEKLVDQEPDPVQQKYEREALQEQAKLEKQAATYAAEEMPARFSTGGATYDEKVAWIEAHGGAAVEGAAIEPGYAEPQ